MLRFIFTEKGFYFEDSGKLSRELQAWQEEFKKDKEYAWFLLGLKGCPVDADISMRFLCRVADSYFQCLTSLPELEISREKTEVLLDSATVAEQSQQLHVPERIFFHLVESNREADFPFAFLATYATKDNHGKINHMPLQYALVEYQTERGKLLKLLSCLNQAAEKSDFVRKAVESGEMFHPLKLTAQEAYQFLKEIPVIEEAGILCRIPNWWKRRAMMVSMNVSLGDDQPSFLGFDALLSMTPHLEVDGTPLTREDIELMLKQTEGLAFLKGKWVEVDHGRLEQLLAQMDEPREGMTFLQALRGQSADTLPEDEGTIISNGKWLAQLLQRLRKPETMRKARVPASLLGNWKREAEKFVPDMQVHILHGGGAAVLAEELSSKEAFLFITTYGMTVKVKEFAEQIWDCLILDEAQAIKNPTAKQTHAIKKIPSRMRTDSGSADTPETDLQSSGSVSGTGQICAGGKRKVGDA